MKQVTSIQYSSKITYVFKGMYYYTVSFSSSMSWMAQPTFNEVVRDTPSCSNCTAPCAWFKERPRTPLLRSNWSPQSTYFSSSFASVNKGFVIVCGCLVITLLIVIINSLESCGHRFAQLIKVIDVLAPLLLVSCLFNFVKFVFHLFSRALS